MPKHIDWEEIRKHWQKTGASSQAIADQFGVSKRSVDERLPKWRDTEKTAPKVVAFEKPPTREPVPRRQRPSIDDIDENEIIRNAICDLSTTMADGDTDPRSLGSIAGALVRLLEYRRKIQPRTAAELAEMAIAQEISPEEFITSLREKWRLRA